MSVYTHTALGAAVGIAAGNPVAAFFLGAATHVVSDAVSHYDSERVWLEVVLAATAGVLLSWISGWRTVVLFGILGAALPDVDNLLISLKVLPKRSKVFPSHGGYLRHGVELGVRNAAVQIAVLGVLTLWVCVAPELL
ncbi:MAG: hypothetical protein JSW52_04840 [Candidatus Coatesbacteria bacterium]|nr:MAG: hypothetical protein JSW52_04840 [Candidatus Coatesbacteria bacterium]